MEILPAISFFTGVISILSPCILPVIPIFVAFGLKSRSAAEILSFIFGFGSVFLAVIILTGFFTSFVYGYLFYIRILCAVILLIMGIMMFFDCSLSFRTFLPKKSDGIVGSFLLGLVTSLSWAPCYSGYLISLIALLVSSGGGFYALFNLVLYCTGFALALFVLSLFISRIDLERMVLKAAYIPKIFAVLIIIAAAYLFFESFKVMI